MATVSETTRETSDPSRVRRMADLLASLGDIPASRVLLDPAPGTATEADAVRLTESGVLCELSTALWWRKRCPCRNRF